MDQTPDSPQVSDERPDERPADDTPARLLDAAIRLFGQNGFAGTSTRAIAKEAGANISAIAYHFGGKAGLQDACFERVVKRIDSVAAQALEPGADMPPRARLHLMVKVMTRFLVISPEAPETARFILRQVQEPGASADRLYDRLFERRHHDLCLLWAAVTGQDPESEAVRLSVFTLLGQILYFRIGETLVARRLNWPQMGPEQAQAVTCVLAANLDAMLDHALTYGEAQ